MPACAPVSEVAGNIQRVQCHRGERDGGLFTGGEQHVHLALARQRHDFLGEPDEIVGHTAHRRDDDDDLIALVAIFFNPPRDILIRSGLPTEVPPNFWTMSAMAIGLQPNHLHDRFFRRRNNGRCEAPLF